VQRRQRRSDGAISLEGKRFEVPARFGHLESLHVAYARWDLRAVELVDPHTGTPLCPSIRWTRRPMPLPSADASPQ
jgi:hypothetical protein